MPVITIRDAQRAGARLLIGMAGVSGGGKTYSALRLAYGLANRNARKIGLIDTENRRGSLYSDKLPNREPFLIADLLPPFSPQRYIEAVKQFQAEGVEVLIIDSITHEWEGEGGCCEIAEKNRLGGLPNWALAKGEHKRFVNTLLYSDMHVVVCIRAREKSRPEDVTDEKTGKKKTVFVPIGDGAEPVCEKNFMFEMTASMIMEDMGARQRVRKCPEDLVPFLGRGQGYITEQDGLAVRQWVDGMSAAGAAAADETAESLKAAERARHLLEAACADGMAALESAWRATPVKLQHELGREYIDTLKESAAAYDAQRAEPEAGEGGR